MDQQAALVNHYRCDRRKLLEFLLSSGLIKELRTPSGPTPTNSLSNLDFDSISADYIIHCVESGIVITLYFLFGCRENRGLVKNELTAPLLLLSGGVVDVTEATCKYSDESAYPVTVIKEIKLLSSFNADFFI